MEILFYSVFAVLLVVAIACQITLFVIQRSLRSAEGRMLELYRSKIDKIPALIEVIRLYSKKAEMYSELADLHRIAIVSSTEKIYDMLEINSHITDRFAFLMRIALSIRSTSKDGNFITIREAITSLEGQIREQLYEYSRITKTYNSVVKARDYTIFGALFPGSKKPIISR